MRVTRSSDTNKEDDKNGILENETEEPQGEEAEETKEEADSSPSGVEEDTKQQAEESTSKEENGVSNAATVKTDKSPTSSVPQAPAPAAVPQVQPQLHPMPAQVPIQPYYPPHQPYPFYPAMGYPGPPPPTAHSTEYGAFYTDASTLADPAPDTRRNRGGVTEPFPEKLHRMLEFSEREGLSDVVSFFSHGRAFSIHKPRRFVTEVMPRFFRQTRLTSFQRQLNLYGFKRISSGPDNGGYYHELFLKGRQGLCVNMKRTKVKGTGKVKRDSESEPNFYAMPPIQAARAATGPPPQPAAPAYYAPPVYYPPQFQHPAAPYTAAQNTAAPQPTVPSPAPTQPSQMPVPPTMMPAAPPPFQYYPYWGAGPPGYHPQQQPPPMAVATTVLPQQQPPPPPQQQPPAQPGPGQVLAQAPAVPVPAPGNADTAAV